MYVCVCAAVTVGFDDERVSIPEGSSNTQVCVSVTSNSQLGRDVVMILDSPPGGCGLCWMGQCEWVVL